MKKLLYVVAAYAMLFSNTASGQSAPGGVGDLSGTSELRLWVSSQSTNVTTNNAPVDSLFDLSGAGNHLYAPSAAARPVLLINQINGYPVINFDGVQQYLLDPVQDTTFRNSEATIIIVAEQAIQGSVISISSSNSVDEFLVFSREVFHHSSPSNWRSLNHQCAVIDTLSGYVIVTGVLGTAVADIQNLNFRIPSTLATVNSSTPIPFNVVDKNVHIGQRDLFHSWEFLEGNLVEIIGYNRKLNSVEIDSVVSYLENKYQIFEQCLSVGVREIGQLAGVSVYPNPTSGSFSISSDNIFVNASIEVFNALGESIYQADIQNLSKVEVNLNNASPGIYFVKVFDGKNHICKKLFVELH